MCPWLCVVQPSAWRTHEPRHDVPSRRGPEDAHPRHIQLDLTPSPLERLRQPSANRKLVSPPDIIRDRLEVDMRGEPVVEREDDDALIEEPLDPVRPLLEVPRPADDPRAAATITTNSAVSIAQGRTARWKERCAVGTHCQKRARG